MFHAHRQYTISSKYVLFEQNRLCRLQITATLNLRVLRFFYPFVYTRQNNESYCQSFHFHVELFKNV